MLSFSLKFCLCPCEATKILQRSLIMLEEKAHCGTSEEIDLDVQLTSDLGINLPTMPSRKSIKEFPLPSTALTACVSPSSIEWTLAAQALVSLANIRTYLEATLVMASRLKREAANASPAISRRRQQGQNFPILTQIVSGFKNLESVWGSKDYPNDVGTLWWDPAAVEADPPKGGMSPSTAGVDCGAYVIGLVVACGFTTDAVYCCGKWFTELKKWSTQRVQNAEPAGAVTGALYLKSSEGINLTMQAMMYLPMEASQWCVERIANVFIHAIPIRITPELKPVHIGILLVPGWAAYMLTDGVLIRSSVVGQVLDTVSALARDLLSVCLQDESRFGLLCAEAVRFIGILTNQLVQKAVSSSPTKNTQTLTSATQRAIAVLRSVFSTFLQPLEESFTTFVARPGMSNTLWTSFVYPFQFLVVERTLSFLSVSPGEVSPMARICSAILRTALYRLLLVVETLGASELSKLNGTSHTAHQQKRYKGMLQHSRGKFTVTLLNAIAEDRQLVLEEANMRSPTGHRILKLHDGCINEDSTHVVLLYLDGGVIRYRVGRRERNFRVAKGVEEVFKIFQS